MKTFTNVCAQGDVYIRRVETLPENAVHVEPKNMFNIVTHSETGHHHVMFAGTATMYRIPDSIMDCLLVVHEPSTLDHLRDHDTHEPIMFGVGTYHVRRQREYTPEGFRRVED